MAGQRDIPVQQHISQRVGTRSFCKLGDVLKEYRLKFQTDHSDQAWDNIAKSKAMNEELLRVLKDTISGTSTAAATTSSSSDGAEAAADAAGDVADAAGTAGNAYDEQVKITNLIAGGRR